MTPGLRSEEPLQHKPSTKYTNKVKEKLQALDSAPVFFIVGDRLDAKIYSYEMAVQSTKAYFSFTPFEIKERGYSQIFLTFDNRELMQKMIHVEGIDDLDKASLDELLRELIIKILFTHVCKEKSNQIVFSSNDIESFKNLQSILDVELAGIKETPVINLMY